MNINEVSFDNFKSLPIEDRNTILNDFDLLKQLVKKNVSTHRYEHSLSVASVCKQLALLHGVDPNKAYLTGLLHDCCKFPDSDTSGVLEAYLNKYDKDKLNGIYGAYHSWVAPYYLKEKLDFNDNDVLNAIYNHTICNSYDPLSLILYIADKREPLRNIDDNILEIAKTDLKKAYDLLIHDVERYLRGKNERFVKSSI